MGCHFLLQWVVVRGFQQTQSKLKQVGRPSLQKCVCVCVHALTCAPVYVYLAHTDTPLLIAGTPNSAIYHPASLWLLGTTNKMSFLNNSHPGGGCVEHMSGGDDDSWEGTQSGGDTSWIKTTSDSRSPHVVRAGRAKPPASSPCFPYFTSGCFKSTLVPNLQTCHPFSSRYVLQSTCCKIMPL